VAFPVDPVDLTVELDLVGDWSDPEDITQYVYGRDLLTITRGKTAEGTTADPSTMTATLNNRDGRFSPRNPTGAYYGSLGRNTPVRASVVAGDVRAYSTDPASGTYFCNDSAGTSITGDIDLRLDMAGVWRGQDLRTLALKYADPDQRSWDWALKTDGSLEFFWSSTGSNLLSATSTVPVPYPVEGRKAIRVTLDVNNGASGNTVTFYTSDTIDGTWTQLGDPVVKAGTTSIFNSTSGNAVLVAGFEVFAFEMRNGIGGTLVASPDFTAQTEGTVTFSDAQSNSWTTLQSAVLSCTARRMRFYGEVSSWPQAWDSTGSDVYSQVTAAGVLRRLSQGATALHSALYRGITSTAGVAAYWPCEDGANSTQVANAGNHDPMTIKFATPQFATFSDFDCSSPLLVTNGASLLGNVPAYTDTAEWQVRCLLAVPDTGDTNGAVLLRIKSSGTTRRWDLIYGTGGTLKLQVYANSGTLGYDSGAIAFAVDGKLLQVSVEAVQTGSDVDLRFTTLEVGATTASYTSTTLTPASLGIVQRVEVDPTGALTGTAVGHIYVQNAETDLFDLSDQLQAWVGETAGARFQRLTEEEGLTAVIVGDPDDTAAMGPQLPATLLDLLKACADADQGLLYEPRDRFGLAYRTRVALHNQDATLTLDYDSQHLSALDPVDDDQAVHNDVTVSRPDGSSSRATLDDGALSTADPPDGIGRYTTSLEANVEADSQLPDLAGWLLHLGTVDEPRYPAIGVDLGRSPYTGSAARTGDALDTDVGAVVELTDLPAWLPPDDTDQLVRGYSETISNFTHTLTYVGEPASPWTVGIYDDTAFRYSSDGSTLAADVTSSATSLSVATPTGPLWFVFASTSFDIVVGGERMTVTATSGTSSPQTFTVTRAVNGVVKAHSAGDTVDLFQPTTYAI
jgi:hypothetical protein